VAESLKGEEDLAFYHEYLAFFVKVKPSIRVKDGLYEALIWSIFKLENKNKS